MNGLEVFTLITEKKTKLEDLIDPTTFVLNPEIEKLQKEIAALQKDCPHEFEGGVCKYCGKEN